MNPTSYQCALWECKAISSKSWSLTRKVSFSTMNQIIQAKTTKERLKKKKKIGGLWVALVKDQIWLLLELCKGNLKGAANSRKLTKPLQIKEVCKWSISLFLCHWLVVTCTKCLQGVISAQGAISAFDAKVVPFPHYSCWYFCYNWKGNFVLSSISPLSVDLTFFFFFL